MNAMNGKGGEYALDPIDRGIVAATQAGLPLTARPYHAIAEQLDLPADEVMRRMAHMLQAGAIRRIGAVANHFTLGWKANGMSVWDVPDEHIDEAGRRVGALEFVSHCYRRPRHPPDWPYNLFAMVHGRDRDEVAGKLSRITAVLGEWDRSHEVLFSSRILKKTGLRIGR